jgi:D-alanyl-D-alanine carboxypeptidase
MGFVCAAKTRPPGLYPRRHKGYLIEADTGRVLWSQNADKKLPWPAPQYYYGIAR